MRRCFDDFNKRASFRFYSKISPQFRAWDLRSVVQFKGRENIVFLELIYGPVDLSALGGRLGVWF